MRRMVALALAPLLIATRAPEPGLTDPHIQSIEFVPNEVVLLRGAVGWQIMLEFGGDERIENVSIGDALAWQVTPNKRARNLFLKPLIKNAATNMTVVTYMRRYRFELETTPRLRDTPWVVSFAYPREVVEAVEEPLPEPAAPVNLRYTLAGDRSLMPLRVWDDGTMTYFEFPAGVAFPAIFAGGPGKDESLVNSMTRGRVVVVQQTDGRFTLRCGKRFATVTYAPIGKKAS